MGMGEGVKEHNSPERHCSSVGLVQSDLRGGLMDSTLIDVLWAKQAP
jgi:hypothetical protein